MRINGKRPKRAAAVVLTAAMTVMAGMTAMADPQVILIGEAAKGGNMAQNEENVQTTQTGNEIFSSHLGLDVTKLPEAEQTDQIVAVVGSETESSSVNVAYFKKDQSGIWTEVFCVPGYCGYYGMSEDKREGDRRTPVGSFGFMSVFGILPDPGSRMPYKQLEEGDFWVDDGNSRYYNQMVNENQTPRDWNSAEELMRITPSYNYVLALDYNTAQRVPGKGSAIFLHGIHPQKTWTEGCIAIPEERVKQLVQELGTGARIVIMPSL